MESDLYRIYIYIYISLQIEGGGLALRKTSIKSLLVMAWSTSWREAIAKQSKSTNKQTTTPRLIQKVYVS